jgi:hypothetical protein
MRAQLVGRSAALAAAAVLAISGTAFADIVNGDADLVTAGNQPSLFLGQVGPGAVLHPHIDFRLSCNGQAHVDPGQTIHLVAIPATVPADGSASATDAEIGPVPNSWADDTGGFASCPDPRPDPISASVQSVATLVAPSTAGGPYTYTFFFDRSLSPIGVADGSAISGTIAVSFSLTVVGNTPPQLHLPADSTHEGNTTGGWQGAWSVSASDAEDNPAPTPTCDHSPADVLPLGTTTIGCSVTDSGRMTATGSFTVTVVDTTPPVLHGVPSGASGVAGESGGAVVTFQTPTATDVVDSSVPVSCEPPSGSTFASGTTTVTCTATDDSGNSASASFGVTVSRFGVVFGEPVGSSRSVVVHSGRNLPIKVEIFRDGVEDMVGPVRLGLAAMDSCPTTAVASTKNAKSQSARNRRLGSVQSSDIDTSFRWDAGAGRWVYGLDLGDWGLAPGGCYRADVIDAGVVAGSFTITVDD